MLLFASNFPRFHNFIILVAFSYEIPFLNYKISNIIDFRMMALPITEIMSRHNWVFKTQPSELCALVKQGFHKFILNVCSKLYLCTNYPKSQGTHTQCGSLAELVCSTAFIIPCLGQHNSHLSALLSR